MCQTYIRCTGWIARDSLPRKNGRIRTLDNKKRTDAQRVDYNDGLLSHHFMLHKWRVWKAELFRVSKHFSRAWCRSTLYLGYETLKVLRKRILKCWFGLTTSRLGACFYAFFTQSLLFVLSTVRIYDFMPQSVWETTFPRLNHAGLGRYLTMRHPYCAVCYLRYIKCTPPKRRFWKEKQRRNADFEGSTFQWFVAQMEYSRPWKVRPSKSAFLFVHPSKIFVWEG